MKGGIVIILASVVALIGLTLPEVNSQETVPMPPICQGTFGTIDCGMNNVVIESAFYGRNGNIICPSGQANTASSCFEDVTDIQQEQRCRNRTTCFLHARPSYNGLACASHPQAYLEVTYSCAIPTTTEMTTPVTTAPTTEMTTPVTTAPTTEMTTPVTTAPTTEMTTPVTTAPTTEMITAPPPKNELVCKGVRSYIKCDEGLIHIVSAVWGRTDTEPACGKTSEERNCELDVIEYLAPLCENEPSCDFKPKGSLFGGSTENPCDGVKKYLNFTYTCEEPTTTMQPTTLQPTTITMQPTVPPATILTPVCQGTFGTINCGSNNVTICSAFYGRNGNIICPSGQANTASSCSEDVTDTWQNQRCSGRTTCYPYARSSWNGNGCASHPQAYLEVTYTCAPEGCPVPALPAS
eukprot:XP_784107.4 PREDICTED: integumentary mucin C.1 [Strongylocentrotus purpuratus]